MEQLDAWLTGLFDGASLLVALGIAFALGLRHASDPDHLVAVTSLVAADDGGTRGATRLGAWWGLGHAATLLLLGVPLIVFKSALPTWLESGAEKAVGVVIIAPGPASHLEVGAAGTTAPARHAHSSRRCRSRAWLPPAPASGRGRGPARATTRVRTPQQAFGIGLLHGLAGTGAVVVLLLTALPTQLEAGLALAVFAPMTIVSMAACTTAVRLGVDPAAWSSPSTAPS